MIIAQIAHPRHNRGDLLRPIYPRRPAEPDPLGNQLRQPGLLGQSHHRHKPNTRHEVLIVKTQPLPWTTHQVVSVPVPSEVRSDQDVDTPDSLAPEGTSASAPPKEHASARDLPRIEA